MPSISGGSVERDPQRNRPAATASFFEFHIGVIGVTAVDGDEEIAPSLQVSDQHRPCRGWLNTAEQFLSFLKPYQRLQKHAQNVLQQRLSRPHECLRTAGVLFVLASGGAEGLQRHPGGVEQSRKVGRGRAAAQGDGDQGHSEGCRKLRLSHHSVSFGFCMSNLVYVELWRCLSRRKNRLSEVVRIHVYRGRLKKRHQSEMK